MRKGPAYCVAPFKKRNGRLDRQDIIACDTAAAAFKRGKAMMARFDGLVFYKIECRAEGDVWTEVLATVGAVPPEAEEAA